jgi:hypothetical protein
MRTRRTQPAVTLDLATFLPQGWKPLGELQPININGDNTTEYLLTFTYDPVANSTDGPIGALIYNPETEAVVADPNTVALVRPAGFLNLHAILPSYWDGKGQGFVGAPGQTVTAYQVAYRQPLTDTQTVLPDTLVLLGGNSYLTFVWWKNPVDGYGVSQLYAPGGFEGVDWVAWQKKPTALTSLVGRVPLNNRSLFCRKTRYDLLTTPADPNPPADNLPGIGFQPTDLGLAFCFGIPEHPFYSEGVVLAYLLDASRRTTWLDPALQETPAAFAPLADLLANNQVVRVDDVQSYPTMGPKKLESSPEPLYTTVCAAVQVSTDQEKAQTEQRLFLFRLEHTPPALNPARPDRLFIHNIQALDAPAGVQQRCQDNM